MKIKIPFTNKQVVLDPIYEGLFILLGIYALFALSILAMAAFGPTKICIFIGAVILIHFLKTSKVKELEVENVEE